MTRLRKEETSLNSSSRILYHPSSFQMSKERSFKDNVRFLFLIYIVQFEEKKFLETARKTIQGAVANAGQKLESENVLTYDPRNANQ